MFRRSVEFLIRVIRYAFASLLGTTLLVCANPALAQFGAVIDIPPDPNIEDNGGLGSGVQVNVFPGGSIGDSFDVGAADGSSTNVELNVSGGVVGQALNANGGSAVNVLAGAVGGGFSARPSSVVVVSGGMVGSGMTIEGAEATISGGNIGNDLHILSGSDVEISGGHVGYFVNAGALDGSSSEVFVGVSGGLIEGGTEVNSGAQWTQTGGVLATLSSYGINFNAGSVGFIYGGVVDADFNTFDESDVSLFGAEFMLDDEPIVATGEKISIPSGSILSGVLADGTPFMLGDVLYDDIAPNTLSLHESDVPPPSPIIYHVPPDVPPQSLRAGQTMFVESGGLVGPYFRAGPGSTVIVNDGEMGRDFEAFGAEIEINGGRVLSDFVAQLGSTVDMDGGYLGSFVDVGRNSVFNLTGGTVSDGFRALFGSEVNISGGSIGGFFGLSSGAELNLSGGAIGHNFSASAGSAVNIFGGEFRLDGALIEGLAAPGATLALDVPAGSLLSGVLQDGATFAFSTQGDAFIANGVLTLHATTLPSAGQTLFEVPDDAAPASLGAGQRLVLAEGGQIGGFDVAALQAGWGSQVDVSGGQISSGVDAVGAVVNIAGGSVQGGGVQAYAGAVVNVSAGTIGFGSTVYRGGRVNLSGGSIGNLEVLAGGAATISGGELLGSNFDAALFGDAGAEIALHGGEIQGRFQLFGTNLDPTFAYVTGGSFGSEVWVQGESELELVGTEFAIDGVPLADLDLGSPSLVDQRNVQLTGLLLDGSPFSFDLNEVLAFGEDWFPAQAALKLTLVFPGDFDFDGTIALSDFSLLKENFGAAGGPADGDANGDGRVDLADFSILKARFGETASVPEPSSLSLAAISTLVLTAAARLVRFRL